MDGQTPGVRLGFIAIGLTARTLAAALAIRSALAALLLTAAHAAFTLAADSLFLVAASGLLAGPLRILLLSATRILIFILVSHHYPPSVGNLQDVNRREYQIG